MAPCFFSPFASVCPHRLYNLFKNCFELFQSRQSSQTSTMISTFCTGSSPSSGLRLSVLGHGQETHSADILLHGAGTGWDFTCHVKALLPHCNSTFKSHLGARLAVRRLLQYITTVSSALLYLLMPFAFVH